MPPAPSKPCGTVGAYFRHYRHGEKPCQACKEAHNAHIRDKYATNAQANTERKAALRARSKAFTRLSQRFRVEYLELLAEELEAEGLDSTRVRDRAWKAALNTAEEEE